MESTNLYSITIPPMRKSLVALSALLDKAQAHADTKKTEKRSYDEALLADRLIFDQFPFYQQIWIATDTAKSGATRLAGKEPPKFGDVEKTVPELKARVEKTLALLDGVKPEEIIGQEDRRITLPYWDGKSLSAFEYATEYLMPNFYFHYATAYAILRKNGVAVGKADFIGGLPLK